jgi:hypothetical protein
VPFGLSFGAKVSKQSGTSTVDKTVDTSQTETGSKATTGTTSSTGTTHGESDWSDEWRDHQCNLQVHKPTSSRARCSAKIFSADSKESLRTLFGSQSTTPMSLNSNFDKSEFVAEGDRAAASRANDDTAIGVE